MKFQPLIVALALATVSPESPAQRVASPAEVFGNPISREADAWLADSTSRFNESLATLQSKWTVGTNEAKVLLQEKKLVFSGPKVKVVFDVLIIGTVRKGDRS